MQDSAVLFCAAGTGGHIFPALAIAGEVAKTHKVIWLGSGGMENILVKDYPIFTVSAVGLRGKNLWHLLKAPIKILVAIWQTSKIIRQQKVKKVVVMGGFIGGIGGIASILTRTKFIIHEQNSIAGTSNKYLNRFSLQSFQAFDYALDNAITCGNPINWRKIDKIPFSGVLNVLVIGGSLGAKKINEIIPKLQIDANIYHQIGKKNTLQTGNKNHIIVNFIDDMASAYAKADVVIARSGAMTISELIYTKTPAILIPYPFAIDNHQVENAKILVAKDCAFMVEEKNLTVNKIDDILQNLTTDKLMEMQNNFSKFDGKNPVEVITKFI